MWMFFDRTGSTWWRGWRFLLLRRCRTSFHSFLEPWAGIFIRTMDCLWGTWTTFILHNLTTFDPSSSCAGAKEGRRRRRTKKKMVGRGSQVIFFLFNIVLFDSVVLKCSFFSSSVVALLSSAASKLVLLVLPKMDRTIADSSGN